MTFIIKSNISIYWISTCNLIGIYIYIYIEIKEDLKMLTFSIWRQISAQMLTFKHVLNNWWTSLDLVSVVNFLPPPPLPKLKRFANKSQNLFVIFKFSHPSPSPTQWGTVVIKIFFVLSFQNDGIRSLYWLVRVQ